jgi:hypothetical protein
MAISGYKYNPKHSYMFIHISKKTTWYDVFSDCFSTYPFIPSYIYIFPYQVTIVTYDIHISHQTFRLYLDDVSILVPSPVVFCSGRPSSVRARRCLRSSKHWHLRRQRSPLRSPWGVVFCKIPSGKLT